MEESPEDRLMEEREELMVSPTGDGQPTLRMAHFLNPSLSSTEQPPLNLSPYSFSSTTSKTQTQKNPLNVSFNGWREPQKNWKSWVDHMCSLHKPVWEKAGIYESILGSVYLIRKDCELVTKVAEKWCPDTNSFLFPFGEATVTLEDMMTLGGYSVLGDSVLTPLPPGKDLGEIREELLQARLELVRGRAKKADQGGWLKKFMISGSRIEHEAFLSLWLSKFVFPSASAYGTIGTDVFPIAILLAKGTKIALAPAVLASIYRDLSLLRKKRENDVSALTLWAPLQLVQVWIWERFPALAPHPNPMRDGDPILARWHMVKKPNTGNVDLAMASSGRCFQWRPYVMAEAHQLIHKLYGETDKWVSVRPHLVEVLESFGRCMRFAELVGLDCIEQYFPHRVAMQFGMDQDVPGKVVFHSDGSSEIAWENYSRPISDAKLYIPSRYFESDVTTRYLEWWKNSNGAKGVVKEEIDCDSDFPPKCTGKIAHTVPSVPPGFPPKGTVKTENKVCFDFSSVPPGFPPNMVSKTGNSDFPSTPAGFPLTIVSTGLGDNESPPVTPIVIGTEKRDFANEGNTPPPTEFINEMKGTQMIDPPSSMSDNGALQSEDLMRSPENKTVSGKDVAEGLERAVEDGNEISGAGNTSSRGEGTVHSRGEKPGLELEARIVKLERLIAGLKAKTLGNRFGS
ncbi:hypothetical protein RHSIM_RhsimUnG0223800 [Rhododendron simsii]|uniref:Aminotransferase-like plant mobile domain-containing protein n=1 Tax=Rhododendron simsii TaxID=118357 RepID=A0A834FTN4_RHOSS|nr:hypothetical protein RHSIM_RhsimUnG0223800 [Rhododendron simsii]